MMRDIVLKKKKKVVKKKSVSACVLVLGVSQNSEPKNRRAQTGHRQSCLPATRDRKRRRSTFLRWARRLRSVDRRVKTSVLSKTHDESTDRLLSPLKSWRISGSQSSGGEVGSSIPLHPTPMFDEIFSQ